MKVPIDIDFSPDEALTFCCLPATGSMQKAIMPEIEERLKGSLNTMTPEDMSKTWMPARFEGFEQMQKMFWPSMTGGKLKREWGRVVALY